MELVSGEADAHPGYGIASCSSRPGTARRRRHRRPPRRPRDARERARRLRHHHAHARRRRRARSARCRASGARCCARTAPRSSCRAGRRRAAPAPDGARRVHVRGPPAARRALRAAAAAGRTLLLNGHVDVVDGRAARRLDAARPVRGRASRDGAVHGRGACDMKGGVACMVLAAERAGRARRAAAPAT